MIPRVTRAVVLDFMASRLVREVLDKPYAAGGRLVERAW